MAANKRFRDAIKGSIANKEAALALIALFDQFEAMQLKVDADLKQFNDTMDKFATDVTAQNAAVAASQLDTDYNTANVMGVDYATTNAIDITI